MVARHVSAVASPAAPGGGLGAAQTAEGVRLTPRRVYILPTRYGLAFGAALVVMLLGSINYNNGLGYALTFLLGAVALVSMLHTCRNLFGLRVRGGAGRPIFVDDLADLPLALDNRGQPARHDVLVRFPATDGDEAAEGMLTAQVPPDEVMRLDLSVRAVRRGSLELASITMVTRYPFGLFRAWAPVAIDARCLVYPSPRGDLPLPTVATAAPRESGHTGTGREDFAGFRDYVRGDSPRLINWKAVARDLGVPVKIYSGENAGDIVLRYADLPYAGVEARLSQLCRWVLEADAEGRRYGLEIPGASVAVGQGPAHRHACLEALALYPGAGTGA